MYIQPFCIVAILCFSHAIKQSAVKENYGPSSRYVKPHRETTVFREEPNLPANPATSFSGTNTPKRALMRAFGEGGQSDTTKQLMCPESLTPLKFGTFRFPLVEEEFLISQEYGTRYRLDRSRTFWDLTISAEQDSKSWFAVSQREAVSSRLFQNPIMSAVYERGYRQNFENAGFPGPDKEFLDAQQFFLDDVTTPNEIVGTRSFGSVVDLSCGSGFMTRRFIKSSKFTQVVSVDLSPAMLLETARRCDEEQIPRPSLMVRADVARLPFATNSIDFVHAGAAMHCWPRLTESLSEVHRVLKPGGKFYASTFFSTFPNVMFQKRPAGGSSSSGFYLFSDSDEIEQFVRGAGFPECRVRKEGRGCAIVKAVKSC